MLLFSVKRTSIKCPETDTATSFSILSPRFYQITNTVITNLVINQRGKNYSFRGSQTVNDK